MVFHKAPAVPIYNYLLQHKTPKFKLVTYQALVIGITYLSYMSYHAAKRPFSVVKGELNPNCTITAINNTCTAWRPFSNPTETQDLFGLLDCAFLLTYALAMFVSGYIAEHTNLRIYLSLGMFFTGIFTSLFGLGFFLKIHSLYFFFLIQILTGITQSTGWPCVVEAVGLWFPEGKRGLIMGIWNTHISVGNIVGTALAAPFVEYNWGLSFVVPGCLIAGIGILVFLFLVPDPREVNMTNLEDTVYSEEDMLLEKENFKAGSNDHPIGIWKALWIPGVIEYSMCLFFAKLVSYTFLFWLPFYIGSISIQGKVYSKSQAADYATLFDVGGAIGGVVAGALNDLSGRPGLVNFLFLVCAAPCLLLLQIYGSTSLSTFIGYLMMTGFFVNGPYALITTAVSASLGAHPCLHGNTKAMAVVTSIIDATGSLGAAVGPLLAGVISSKTNSWVFVFYMLILADVLAALFLSRQLFCEIKAICGRRNKSQINSNQLVINEN
ncbi:glucose-6-phosphate exchanger SLC37A2 [Hydra vulgaris]|uniref:Sugar phosphate exchanger 3 n=1 Tax=Hydra vulgaris TaxID=6087 RepID=A0ABM4C2M4_HYDVU